MTDNAGSGATAEMLARIKSAYCADPVGTAENAWNDALEHLEEGLLEHPIPDAAQARIRELEYVVRNFRNCPDNHCEDCRKLARAALTSGAEESK